MSFKLHDYRTLWAPLLVCASACLADTARAQADWMRVAALAQGHVLHAQSPQLPAAGQVLQLNSLVDYSQPQHWGSRGERFQSSTAQWELNCSSRTYRSISFTAHTDRMGQGPVVTRQAQATEWAAATAGSIPAELMRWACR